MTTIDFGPLYRALIGVDRLLADFGPPAAFPPYNIEKTGEAGYRIVLAVAGFRESDLRIVLRENVLTVEGQRPEEEADRQFLHRGIAGRSFRQVFRLAPDLRVAGAELRDGLLTIDLVQEVPEEKKPKQIEIRSAA
jgi:molecular chaperone IbpA